jgi:hypothetical protein
VVCEDPTEVHLHTWGAVQLQDGPHPLLAHEYATTELFHAPPMITRSQDRTVGLTWGLPRGLLAPRPSQLFSERHSALAQVIGDVVSCPAACVRCANLSDVRAIFLNVGCSFLNHAEKFLYHPKGALFCGSAPSTETEIGARAGPWVLESI